MPHDGAAPPPPPGLPSRSRQSRLYRALGDTQLVEAMRRDEPGAIDEFLTRFHRLLLNRAERLRIPGDVASDCALEVLERVAERLCSGALAPPRSLPTYLMAAFRKHHAMRRREARRAERWLADAATERGGTAERVVAESCSAYTAHVCEPPGHPEVAVSAALARLGAAVEAMMTPEERRMMGWVAERIPQRDIAAWLGLQYSATIQRISRLRARLRRELHRYLAGLPDVERRDAERLLRRFGLLETPPESERPTGTDRQPVPRGRGDR